MKSRAFPDRVALAIYDHYDQVAAGEQPRCSPLCPEHKDDECPALFHARHLRRGFEETIARAHEIQRQMLHVLEGLEVIQDFETLRAVLRDRHPCWHP
jgi:hypothetical protein